jgi:hypothetical protein
MQGVRVHTETGGEVAGGDGLIAQLIRHPELGLRGQQRGDRMAPYKIGEPMAAAKGAWQSSARS